MVHQQTAHERAKITKGFKSRANEALSHFEHACDSPPEGKQWSKEPPRLRWSPRLLFLQVNNA